MKIYNKLENILIETVNVEIKENYIYCQIMGNSHMTCICKYKDELIENNKISGHKLCEFALEEMVKYFQSYPNGIYILPNQDEMKIQYARLR